MGLHSHIVSYYQCQCDKCNKLFNQPALSERAAHAFARTAGWVTDEKTDAATCRECFAIDLIVQTSTRVLTKKCERCKVQINYLEGGTVPLLCDHCTALTTKI